MSGICQKIMIVNRRPSRHLAVMDAVNFTQFMKHQPFVAFDTETTGLWAISNRLVEIAAVRFTFEDGQIDIFQSLINPQRNIPPEVIRIHGITDDMVADADPVGPVLRRFGDWLNAEDILMAHNAMFDIAFVACELERESMTLADNLILDTVDICHRCLPGLPSYSLLALCRVLGIAQMQEHRAMGDARLVQSLFALAAEKFPEIQSVEELSTKFAVHTMDEGRNGKIRLPERLEDINHAIEEKLRIEMVYTSAGQAPRTRTVRPVALHQTNAVVYMNAFCELAGEERTFRIDRIQDIRVLQA